MSAPTTAPNQPEEQPWVATVDATKGLPLAEARLMAKRFWYLGWFLLPLAWATNAYYFWPHVSGEVGMVGGDSDEALLRSDDTTGDTTREEGTATSTSTHAHQKNTITVDPAIKKYATRSLRGALAVFAVALLWAVAFTFGGKEMLGDTTWKWLSITAQPPPAE